MEFRGSIISLESQQHNGKGVNNVVEFMAFLRCPLSSLYCSKDQKKMNRLRISWSILLKNKKRTFNAFFTSPFIVVNSFMTLIYLFFKKVCAMALTFQKSPFCSYRKRELKNRVKIKNWTFLINLLLLHFCRRNEIEIENS